MRDHITGQQFAITRCGICGLGVTKPQLDDLTSYYPPAYRKYTGLTRACLRWLYGRRMRSVTKRMNRLGIALDMGCGDGWMLDALRRQGWSVLGIERTPQSARAAWVEHGVPAIAGGLEAIQARPCADLIIMFHVLEHLPDPLEALCQCAARLKPGGWLLVSVPNLESWQARWFGRHWFHLDVPRHLFHFSPSSVKHALASAGLEVRCLRFTSWEHDPYGWLQSALNQLGFPQNQLTKRLMGDHGAARLTPQRVAMGLVAALFIVPSVVLSVASWMAGRGAILEVVAAKSHT
ncbi:MAG: class I SAM-dependent methyltransferase [Candidatus Omnitrophica bacterium]|nr:class I SAM-dependent methyltransferase [Candidatus Omnitrophota bacterium]